MQKLSCPSDGETLIKDHLDKLDSFLHKKDYTSVKILEYLFLCLAFYSISLIFVVLIIFINFIIRDFSMLLLESLSLGWQSTRL